MTGPGQADLTVNLLWTGGWDSTFRLLTLLSDYPCRVQPYYIIDRDRPSWRIEMARIEKIWSICQADDIRPVGTVLAPVMVEKDGIEPAPEITEQFRQLIGRTHVSPQSEWLARFAKQHALDDLEIGVQRDGSTHRLLSSHVELEAGPIRRYRLRPDAPRELALFEPFRFPLFDLIKADMEALGKERGFLQVLELTWSCYRPLAGGWPCGVCIPCQHTVYEGLRRRVGWPGVVCHYALMPVGRVLPQGLRRLGGRCFSLLTRRA